MDGVLCAVGGGQSGIRVDDGLAPRWFAACLCALVIVERRLERRDAFPPETSSLADARTSAVACNSRM